jgi:hypothetical protein
MNKITSIVLGTMTMNAGRGIPGSTIRWALRNNFSQFERVVVVDGCLTDEAREFYSQFSNVEVVDSPWIDSYVKQYQAFADRLKDGQWGLWLDDDEIWTNCVYATRTPGEMGYVGSYFDWESKNNDIIRLPCVLHLTEDGKNFYASEKPPQDSELKPNQWTKNILFKKNDGLYFRHFGSHVIPENKSGRYGYLPFAYYHMKSLESFVYNDVWQAFLSPEGQGYSPVDSRLFKMFTSCYKTTKEFKEATKKGTWPPTLKKFAWEKRKEYNHPISRLSWVYFILEGHLMPEYDDFMYWNTVKQYVLSEDSMKIYNDNLKNNLGIKIDEN